MSYEKHFDLQELARLTLFFQNLCGYFNPQQSIEQFLMIAAAMERVSIELRQRAAELAREREQG